MNTPATEDLGATRRIYEIEHFLLDRSDASHPVTQEMLQEMLRSKGFGNVKRATISNDIKTLLSAGMDIEETALSHSKGYYVPEKYIDFSDMKILLNLVHASGFLSEEKADGIIRRIRELGTQECRDRLDKTWLIYNGCRRSNYATLYTLDEAEQAIAEGKKLSFTYYDDICKERDVPHREPDKTVDPYAVITDEGRLYLLAWDPHAPDEKTRRRGAYRSYRIDRMRSAQMLEKPAGEEALLRRNRGISEEMKASFRMFLDGEEVQATLSFPLRLSGEIHDKFGEDIAIETAEEELCRVTVPVRLSGNFYGWLLQFGGEILLDGPEAVADAYDKYLTKVRKRQRDARGGA